MRRAISALPFYAEEPQWDAFTWLRIWDDNEFPDTGPSLTTDRARIWREAGRQISATINSTYQHQQAVQDRAAQQFSQTLRGVEPMSTRVPVLAWSLRADMTTPG